MNIETKIKEIEAQIEDRTKTERILSAECDRLREIHMQSLRAWSPVYQHIETLKQRREILIQMLKDCECVISRGVPVPDEDIGRTVPLPPEFKGLDGDVKATHSIVMADRVPVFTNDQEKEFLK